jgi:glucosylglycerol-phosphate synthase
VLTNPFSHRSMDSAIDQALDMGEEERRSRMAALRRKVAAYDIRAWAEEQQRLFDMASESRADSDGRDAA